MSSSVMMALIFALAGAVAVIIVLFRKLSAAKPAEQTPQTLTLFAELQRDLHQMRSDMQTQILQIAQQVNSHLDQSTQTLRSSQETFFKTVGQVQERLGQLHESTQKMVDIGQDIASLQDILRTPKLRGGLGEFLLGELLKQVLPAEHYAEQYRFKAGVQVDAVIFLGQGVIPIDAKFPMEDFQRILAATEEPEIQKARKGFSQAVKKHIDSIASKYILPDEKTFDFAMMYIPAENVYYEVIIKSDFEDESILKYALDKKVIPVSPNSFYAYLQAIVRGLKGLRIEQSAKMILQSLGQMEADLRVFLEDFDKVGGHLGNAQTAYGKAMKRFEKLQNRFAAMQDSGDTARLEGPGAEKITVKTGG
ncbi:MAG: DNA recombination protein RmuC [Candidatus Omnitrophota bacterium]